MYDQSQLMRGSLEGCILMIIARQETYGYELLMNLKAYGFVEVSEGSIYPILLRLEKQGMIQSLFHPSPLGPRRKYYHMTMDGRKYLSEFIQSWRNLTALVEAIINEGNETEGNNNESIIS